MLGDDDPNDAKASAEALRRDSAQIEADMLRALERRTDPEPWWHDPQKAERYHRRHRFEMRLVTWYIAVIVLAGAVLITWAAWGREVEQPNPPPPPPKDQPLACRNGVMLPACQRAKVGE